MGLGAPSDGGADGDGGAADDGDADDGAGGGDGGGDLHTDTSDEGLPHGESFFGARIVPP